MMKVTTSLARLDDTVLLYLFKYIQAYIFDVDLSRTNDMLLQEFFETQRHKLVEKDAIFAAREAIPSGIGEYKYAVLLDRLRYARGEPLVFRLKIPYQRGGYHADFLGPDLMKGYTLRNGVKTSPLLYLGTSVDGRVSPGSSLSPTLPVELSELGYFVNRTLLEAEMAVAV